MLIFPAQTVLDAPRCACSSAAPAHAVCATHQRVRAPGTSRRSVAAASLPASISAVQQLVTSGSLALVLYYLASEYLGSAKQDQTGRRVHCEGGTQTRTSARERCKHAYASSRVPSSAAELLLLLRRPCPACNGTGMEACFCTRWSDGDFGCNTCNHTGRIPCHVCRGGGNAVPIKLEVFMDEEKIVREQRRRQGLPDDWGQQ